MKQGMYVQLPLKIGLRDVACFETYIAETESQNIALHDFQQSLLNNQAEAYYLYGTSGVGKTHLLQAACRMAMKRSLQSVYLPLADTTLPFIADVLNGLEQTDVVCIDDFDLKVGETSWELALVNLIQKSKVLGNKVIFSGKTAFGDWQTATEDLALAQISVIPIHLTPLTKETNLVLALQRHSHKIGFDLPLEVGNFCVRQFSSNLQELLSVLKLIEQASLTDKRRVTLPFVKQMLSAL